MRRSLVSAALAGAALLTLPITAHADVNDVNTVQLPFLWPRAELDDVAPDGAGGVWVGGAQGAYCIQWIGECALYSSGNPLVRRRTGSSWQTYSINGWTGNGVISKVVSGAGQTWIGGSAIDSSNYDYLGVLVGSAFQKVAKPSDASLGLLSTGPGGTWITQLVRPDSPQPRLLRRSGSTWEDLDVPDRQMVVDDVQGTSATDVWAVGSRPDEVGNGRHPAVARFDGTSWTWAAAPALTSIERIQTIGANDVWVSGGDRLAHWDGAAWTVVEGPGYIADFTVDATGTLYAATPYADEGRLYRRSGGAWVSVTVPAGTRLYDITSSGGSTIWGVGRVNDDPVAVTG